MTRDTLAVIFFLIVVVVGYLAFFTPVFLPKDVRKAIDEERARRAARVFEEDYGPMTPDRLRAIVAELDKSLREQGGGFLGFRRRRVRNMQRLLTLRAQHLEEK